MKVIHFVLHWLLKMIHMTCDKSWRTWRGSSAILTILASRLRMPLINKAKSRPENQMNLKIHFELGFLCFSSVTSFVSCSLSGSTFFISGNAPILLTPISRISCVYLFLFVVVCEFVFVCFFFFLYPWLLQWLLNHRLVVFSWWIISSDLCVRWWALSIALNSLLYLSWINNQVPPFSHLNCMVLPSTQTRNFSRPWVLILMWMAVAVFWHSLV